MINLTVQDGFISGSYGKTQFVVRYTTERYDAMKKLAAEVGSCSSMADLYALYTKFAELTTESYKTRVETTCPYIVVNEETGKFYLKHNDKVSRIAMPEILVDRIKTSIEKNVDFMPLIKFWIRFLRNPKLRALDLREQEIFAERVARYINTDFLNQSLYEAALESGMSEDVALKRATVKDVQITQEGLICTYKVANEITTKWGLDEEGNPITKDRYKKTIDENTGLIKTILPETVEERLFEPAVMRNSGDAFACIGTNGFPNEGHFIKVGCVIQLDSWSKVNCDDNQSCVKGLHTGGLRYVQGWQHAGTETLNCFVDPMHIGAVDHDGTGALRVLQYFVHSAWEGTNGSIYHSSQYAAQTDELWAIMRKEAVELFSEEVKKINQELDEINSLDA